MTQKILSGDVLALIERLRDHLRAERALREQLDAARHTVADLLAALAASHVPRIVVARRVASDLGYGTNIGELLAAIDVLRKRLARARRRQQTGAKPSPDGSGDPKRAT